MSLTLVSSAGARSGLELSLGSRTDRRVRLRSERSPRAGPSASLSVRLGDRPLRGQLRQHLAGEELRRGDLALVERLGRCAAGPAGQRGERDLGLAQQQPADDEVAEREQQPGGVLPDLVDVASRPACGRGQLADHRADDALHVLERLAEQLALGRQRARCRPRPWRTPGSRSAARSAPGPGRARSCGRRGPCPGSPSCPRTGCRSWRRGCTARSGSPAGSPSRRSICSDSEPSSS